MEWAVEIQNTTLDQRNLSDLLEGLGFTLTEGIDLPAFTSPSMDQCETAKDVFEIAKQLRNAFTGSAQIDTSLRIGSVIDFSSNPPSRHGFLECLSIVCKASVECGTLKVSPPANLNADELVKWKEMRTEQEYQARLENQRAKFEPAFQNPRAPKVLELLSTEEPTGETLYKIYELAEEHPSKRKEFQTQFGIKKEEFNRFKDAVHNPSVSGEWARHAYQDKPKTSDPMSKAEAESFVRRIANQWLKHVRETRNNISPPK
jgi:hypothetical protein